MMKTDKLTSHSCWSIEERPQFFEAVLSSMPDFVYALDRDRRFVYVNKAMQELFGRETEMLGKTFEDLNFPADLAARLNQHLDTIFATGQTIEDEVFYTSPTGVSAYFNFTWSAFRESDEAIQLVVGVSRNLTNRTGAALSGWTGTWLYRIATDEIILDPAMARLMGFPPENRAITLQQFVDIIHPNDCQSVMTVLNDSLRHGHIINIDFRVILADGSVHWIKKRGEVIRDTEGNPVRVSGSAIDITESRQAQQTLRENQEQQAFLLRFNDALRIKPDDSSIRETVTNLICEYLNADRCYLSRISNYDNTLIISPEFHGPDLNDISGTYTLLDFPGFLWELKTEPIAIADTTQDSRLSENEREQLQHARIGALLVTPLPSKEKDEACAIAVTATKSRYWTSTEIALLQEVAQRLYTALDRACTEAALRKSESRLKLITETGPVSVLFFNEKGILIDANDVFIKTSGWTRRDIASGMLSWRTMTPPEWMEISEKQTEQLKSTGRIGPYEKELLFKGGKRSWMLFAGRDLQDGTYVKFAVDINDRKRAETALREAELQYRARLESEVRTRTAELNESRDLLQAIFDTSAHSFSVLKSIRNAEGDIVDFEFRYVNKEVKRRTGIDDLVGMRFSEVYPGVEQTIWFTRYRNIVETGQAMKFEDHYEATDRWLSVAAQKIDDGLIVTFEDTTYRKKAEQQLISSQAQLQSIFDTTIIQMYILEAVHDEAGNIYDLKFTFLNKEVENATARTDLIGKLLVAEYPGIKQNGIFDLILKAIKTGVPQRTEFFYPSEGLKKWFSCTFVKLGDGIVASNLDITARKHAEEERLKNLLLLAQSEEIARFGSWDIDLATGAYTWSNGMYRLFNVRQGTKIEPEIYLQYATDDCRAAAEKVIKYLKSGDTDFEETMEITVDDQTKVLQLKATVIRDEKDRPVRLLGVDMDITAIREAEEKIRRMEAEQQREIFRVTLSTQEEERRRISESLHNGLGQLLYGIKLSLANLTQKQAINNAGIFEADRKYTENLLGNSISECRRISHELMPSILEEFGLKAAIEHTCEQLSEGMNFTCNIKGLKNRLDKYLELAIFRTVQELMVNVIKHAEATEANAALDVQPEMIHIRVWDNGQGIDAGLKNKPGIGLASIRSKIRLLNGTVRVRSQKGVGTLVEVDIPIQEDSYQ